jgi:hypothetical protein
MALCASMKETREQIQCGRSFMILKTKKFLELREIRHAKNLLKIPE